MPSDIFDPIAATNAAHPGIDAWNGLFNSIAPEWNVPPNLVKAHCLYESGGNPTAIGFTGRGLGLMQLDAGTFLDGAGWKYAAPSGQVYNKPLDPATNIEIACRDFIAKNMAAFPTNLDAVIAAYNAGIGRVSNAVETGKDPASVTYDPHYVANVRNAYSWLNATSHRVLGR
jgi:soluble lytic murein transglycosylase-like protein